MQIKQAIISSHLGSVREFNEDMVREYRDLALYALADGTSSGQGRGRQVAEAALNSLDQYLSALRKHKALVAQERDAPNRLALASLMNDIFNQASQAVREEALRIGDAKCATTLLLATIIRNYAYIAHVGNSPAYLLRGDELIRLNEDHSLAAYRYRRGRISRQEYEQSPHRHRLYQALGNGMELEVDMAEIRLTENEVLLLCSDGLTRSLEPQMIAHLIRPDDLSQSMSNLLQEAHRCGVPDNISIILLSFTATPDDEPLEAITEAMRKVFLFRDLSEPELLIIAPYLEEAVYDKGSLIIQEGDIGEHFYVVVSGQVRITKAQCHLHDLGPGSHFGELSLIQGRQRMFTVRALTQVHLFSLSRERFHKILHQKPELSARLAIMLLDTIGSQLSDMSERLAALERLKVMCESQI